jgi:hypothetical protein
VVALMSPAVTSSTAHLHSNGALRVPVMWGLVFGAAQAACPLAFRWLEPSTVHALSISLIAAIYIGFAVADRRPAILAVEAVVAGGFVVLAATAVTGSAWLLVIAYAAHGLKDLRQERRHFVANTRWWPPFCATVDLLVAGVIAVEIAIGVNFH